MRMKLDILDGNNINKVNKSQIYLVGIQKRCFSELDEKFDILDQINGIIDNNLYQSYRSYVLNGKIVNIMCYDDIKAVPDNSILLILGGDYSFRFKELCGLPFVTTKFDVVYYYPNLEGHYLQRYTAKYEEEELKNILVFRSGLDASLVLKEWEFADNARALFEFMLSKGFNEKYRLVWLVQNPNLYYLKYKDVKNVEFLPYNAAISNNQELRDKYYEVICLAKYIFFCQGYAFARNVRGDQIRVQLWHGCGFKGNYSAKEMLRYEYMTVTSDLYAKIHADSFGLRSDQLLVTGLPKNDWIFHPLSDWRERFDIPIASKYIFWLPTFREASDNEYMISGVVVNVDTGMPIIKTMQMFTDLNDILKHNNIMLIIKLHSAQNKNGFPDWKLSNVILLDNDSFVKTTTEINEILGHADALISDYSSVATGYMLLDRPIAFTMDDYESYHRGFHWSIEELPDWLPGEIIFEFDDLVKFIQNVANGVDTSKQKRHHLMPYFHKFCDDHSSERVLRTLGITKE